MGGILGIGFIKTNQTSVKILKKAKYENNDNYLCL